MDKILIALTSLLVVLAIKSGSDVSGSVELLPPTEQAAVAPTTTKAKPGSRKIEKLYTQPKEDKETVNLSDGAYFQLRLIAMDLPKIKTSAEKLGGSSMFLNTVKILIEDAIKNDPSDYKRIVMEGVKYMALEMIKSPNVDIKVLVDEAFKVIVKPQLGK